MARTKRKKHSEIDEAALAITVLTYNPWWGKKEHAWKNPEFRRDYFSSAAGHLEAKHGLALLINGPRRVGKTTLMYQLMEWLGEEKLVANNRILFFSLDDPFIQQLPVEERGAAFEKVLGEWEKRLGGPLKESGQTLYCFLDEVQRLPNWELYVKRYVDLRYPIRFVISGSASHTIFRKSLESLLGRLVDISLPPFTFREWVRFHSSEFAGALTGIGEMRIDIRDRSSIAGAVRGILSALGDGAVEKLNLLAKEYARAGGFPQLWDLGVIERAQFVDLQYVQRVTLEDLLLVREIRRPEIFHQFLRYAFARTGEEYNLEALAEQIRTTRVTLTGALPLLLQTELIRKVERFTNKPVRLRSTHAKLYAADLALYEAITKTPADLAGEDRGRVAETLVHNVLCRLAGITDITYFRLPDGSREIDFVVRSGRILTPVEVKWRHQKHAGDKESIHHFIEAYARNGYGILIGEGDLSLDGPVMEIPLGIFLLLS